MHAGLKSSIKRNYKVPLLSMYIEHGTKLEYDFTYKNTVYSFMYTGLAIFQADADYCSKLTCKLIQFSAVPGPES